MDTMEKKYLKYKAKYMALKSMLGGGYFKDISGAGQPIPHKSYYIMADIGNPDINKAFNQRRDCILDSANAGHNFHITLLTIEINRSLKQYADKLEDSVQVAQGKTTKTLKPILQKMANDAYNDTFRKSRVILNQERGKYNKMGSFFVKRYPISFDAQTLTDSKGNILPTINAFRKSFYDKLRAHLGVNFIFDDKSNKDYALAINPANGDVIFAVPKYDFGKGTWEPHVSVVKETDIQTFNPILHGRIQATHNPEDEVLKCLLPYQFSELPNIDMSKDIMGVRIG